MLVGRSPHARKLVDNDKSPLVSDERSQRLTESRRGASVSAEENPPGSAEDHTFMVYATPNAQPSKAYCHTSVQGADSGVCEGEQL